MSTSIRRPETELYQETYGTRFYDDPELSHVFHPDEARTDALIEEAVQLDREALEAWIERRNTANPCNVLDEGAVLDREALEEWVEQRDAADPHNVLVEE